MVLCACVWCTTFHFIKLIVRVLDSDWLEAVVKYSINVACGLLLKSVLVCSAWGQTLVWLLTLLVELGVYVLALYSTALLFQIDVNWKAKTISSKTGD